MCHVYTCIRGISHLIFERKIQPTPTEDFENFLFGDELGLPHHKKKERNTYDEDELSSDLTNHFHGEMQELNKWIPTLKKLEQMGTYSYFLTVPEKYKFAYRAMSIKKNIDKFIKTNEISYEELEHQKPVKITKKFKFINQHTHSSWTVDKNALRKINEDWDGISRRIDDYFIILAAKIRSNNNHFILNPDKTSVWAQEYTYQKEIIAVSKHIECDSAWLIKIGTDKGLNDYDAEKEAKHIKKITKDIRSFEKQNITK